MTEKGCDNCYYSYFDERAYPCSLCIRGIERTDQWQPSKKIKADIPQAERIKTPDYCDICNHKGCDNCTANSLDDYCVPSGYKPKTKPICESCSKNPCKKKEMINDIGHWVSECTEFDRKTEPQTCGTCKWGEWYRKGYDITMMSDECGGCCSWNNKWTPKDEPQTEHLEQFRVGLEYHTDTTHFGKKKGESVTTNKIEDEPQTDCSWKKGE